MSISITTTEQKLRAIVAPKLRVPPEQVPLDKSLLEELNLDSFDLMTVILEIEEAFAPVTISDKSAEELLTLRELATYIDKEIGLARTPPRTPTSSLSDTFHSGQASDPTPPQGDHEKSERIRKYAIDR